MTAPTGKSGKSDKSLRRASRRSAPTGLGLLFLLSFTHEIAQARTELPAPDAVRSLLQLSPAELQPLLDMLVETYPELAERLVAETEDGQVVSIDREELERQLAELEASGYLETEETQRLLASLRNLQVMPAAGDEEDVQLAQAGGGTATDAGEPGADDIENLPATGAGPAAFALGPIVGGVAGAVGLASLGGGGGGTVVAPIIATPLTVTLTDSEAAAQVLAGVQYAAADNVTIEVAAGTQLQTSLKGMQTLGVDTLAISGGTGAVMVEAFGAGESGTLSGLPAVSNSSGATLGVDVSQSEFDLLAASDLLAFANAGFDLIGADGAAASSLSLTEAQATNMLAAGLEFAGADEITLQAAGTQLGTSLTNLQTLGVDAVSSAGNLHIDATGIINYAALPDVSGVAGDATLEISDAGFGALSLSNLQSLATAGFEQIGGADGSLTASEAQAANMLATSLVFDAADDITLQAAGTDLSTSISDLNTLGVDTVSALDSAIGLNAADALDLITNGIDLTFTNSDGSVDISLATLADLGADRVFSSSSAPVTLEVDLGVTVGDLNALQTALNSIVSEFEANNGTIAASGPDSFKHLFETRDTVNLKVDASFTGDLSALDPTLVQKLELLGIDDILNTNGTSLK